MENKSTERTQILSTGFVSQSSSFNSPSPSLYWFSHWFSLSLFLPFLSFLFFLSLFRFLLAMTEPDKEETQKQQEEQQQTQDQQTRNQTPLPHQQPQIPPPHLPFYPQAYVMPHPYFGRFKMVKKTRKKHVNCFAFFFSLFRCCGFLFVCLFVFYCISLRYFSPLFR